MFTFPSNRLGQNGTEYYAIGGVTVEFSPLVMGEPSAVMANLGPIMDFTPQVEIENYEHFDSRSGQRVRDLVIPISQTMSFQFTSEEFNPFVMAALFLASGYAEPGETAQAANESTVLDSAGYAPLRYVPVSDSPMTVRMGNTTLTASDDYMLTVTQEGKAYIVRNPAGQVPAGATLTVSYSYMTSEQLILTPLTNNNIEGSARITYRTSTGKNWQWQHSRCTLTPTGTAAFNDQEVSTAEFTLDALLDNAQVVMVDSQETKAPFGFIRYGITF